jgi:ubiquinone/menaquinone biosynthesis C-methylase UbiE
MPFQRPRAKALKRRPKPQVAIYTATPDGTLTLRPVHYEPTHFGTRLTPLQRRLLAVQKRLISEDHQQDNEAAAKLHARIDHHEDVQRMGDIAYMSNDRMRVARHYAPIHTLLELIGKKKLKGEKILHLAGSTGVYAKYLHDQLRMRPVVLDMDKTSLREAHRERNIKWVVRASAVPEKKATGNFIVPKGKLIAVPEYTTTRIPFRDKSFKFVISDHFLFANYQPNMGGFEHREGSIERSEETLPELNRILEKGGYALIGDAHARSLPDLRRYGVGYRTNGFVVVAAYDGHLIPTPKGIAPTFFVLQKIKDYKE